MTKRVLTDFFIWIIAIFFCFVWRWLTAKSEIGGYIALFVVLCAIWILLGMICRKYSQSYRDTWFWQDILIMCGIGGVLLLATHFLLPYYAPELSLIVAEWGIGLVMILDAVYILFQHYWKYALNMTTPSIVIEQRENAVVRREDAMRSQESIQTIHEVILSISNEQSYQMLVDKANLNNRRTKVVVNRDRVVFMQIPDYQYDTLVDMTLLNDAKGINRRFCIANNKLPDNGRYICCFRPQDVAKQKVLNRYPKGINYIMYFFWFIYRRVLPRMLLMSRLYYDVTKGRKRVLSKTEVLGRLYYCGFEVEDIVRIDRIDYVFARRHSQPYEQEQMKVYGPLIKLPRVCQNKEIRFFYKFRTMHPYSEYIQKYVFDQRGGMNIADKSDDDWRITHWGKIMRKYWIDELPMLINFLKRDVKLVGVRPLSRTMFDQYPLDLQEKRTRTKPGLIPPFYVDHPKTFQELYDSENKYLDEYFKHPIMTDIRYFFKTMNSILFRRMHSA